MAFDVEKALYWINQTTKFIAICRFASFLFLKDKNKCIG